MKILSLLIAPLGLLGNRAVLWLLGFRIPRNHFSVYILNLAAADALFLCSHFLLQLTHLVAPLGEINVQVFLINATLLTDTSNLGLLAAIRTERCLTVLFPGWYLSARPRHTSAVLCAALWALLGLFWTAHLGFCLYFMYGFFCSAIPDVPVVRLLHFSPLLCVSSLTLLLRVQGSSLRRRPPRLYRLVLIMVLIFLLCDLPQNMHNTMPRLLSFFMAPWLPVLLTCVNRSSYPFIYLLLGRTKQRRGESLGMTLQRALDDEQELEKVIRDSPHTNIGKTSF
ncbi:mas-related G-protein coupled receptor member X4-like [Sarcophilus harrisii]|uniref:mas-related G-protein coupled receptor member X4-like n=1 Tax=Sarcophilus harrisii TaxID=9305 RepID=UPI000273C3F2|nr:mas-related G-protein coupled receptor member X4-like [Sarcophilus harrisii]